MLPCTTVLSIEERAYGYSNISQIISVADGNQRVNRPTWTELISGARHCIRQFISIFLHSFATIQRGRYNRYSFYSHKKIKAQNFKKLNYLYIPYKRHSEYNKTQ